MQKDYDDIPGTFVFDTDRARDGYPLNMFCYSLRFAENRDAFAADNEAYMDRYAMTEAQKQAIRDRNWNGLLEEGGNIYYTAKLAAFDKITFQELAAMMSGMTSEGYREMMVAGGRSVEGNRYKHEWETR